MNQALVEIRNVNVELGGQVVLRDVTWRLCPGEHWTVLGANGSGKSTFLKLVRGELWPAPGCGGGRTYWMEGELQEQSSAVGIKERFPLVSPEAQSRYLYQEWSLTASTVTCGDGDKLDAKLVGGLDQC